MRRHGAGLMLHRDSLYLERGEIGRDYDDLRARYLERHPQASQYFALADFGLRVLRVAEARYVAGFGDMGWISGVDLRQALKGHTI